MLVLEILGTLLSVGLTVGLALVCTSILIGWPVVHRTALVAHADTASGEESLARYLAKRAGQRNTDELWQSFLPAAQSLNQQHMLRRDTLLSA